MNPPEFFRPSDKYQVVPDPARFELPPAGQYYTNGHTGVSYVRWPAPVPRPDTVIDKRTGKQQVVPDLEQSTQSGSQDYAQSVTPDQEQEYAPGAASSQSETAQAKET